MGVFFSWSVVCTRMSVEMKGLVVLMILALPVDAKPNDNKKNSFLDSLECKDGTHATCICQDGSNPPCGLNGVLSLFGGMICTCSDGSHPSIHHFSLLRPPSCADASTPICTCAEGSIPATPQENRMTCPDLHQPSCICADGSEAQRVGFCADGSFPACPGACSDGTDAHLDGIRPHACHGEPNRNVKWEKCRCKDGSSFKWT